VCVLIWHTWKSVLYYRFPAFISINYKISWEEGKGSTKCQRKGKKSSRKAGLGSEKGGMRATLLPWCSLWLTADMAEFIVSHPTGLHLPYS
jgi:hypothetical protein